MADQGLKIVIGAEVSQAVKGLSQLDASLSKLGTSADLSKVEKELDDLQKKGVLSFGAINIAIKGLQDQLKSTNAPAEIAKINTAIAALQARAKNFKPTVGFDDFDVKAKSITGATNKLTGSFLGLAKTFNVLPPELQHLTHTFEGVLSALEKISHSTDSTSGKVKQFATAFASIGVGIGISLAISAVTASLAELVKRFTDAESAAKKFDESFATAVKDSGKELSTLKSLVEVARDENQSRQIRQNAIDQLQKTYPNYLRNISLETINSQAAKVAIDSLSSSIFQKALAEQLASRVAEKQIKLFDLQKRAMLELDQVVNARKGAASGFGDVRTSAVRNLERTREEMRELNEEMLELQRSATEAVSKSLDFAPTPKPGKIKVAFEALARLINDQREFVALQETKPLVLSPSFQFLVDDAKAGLAFSSLKKQLEDKLKFFSVQNSSVPLPIRTQIEIDPNLTLPPGIRDEKIAELASQFASGTPLKIDGLTVELDKTKLRQQLQTQISDAIAGMGADTFANFGDILGDALSGEGLKGAFENFGKIISQGLSSIGKALIKAGTLALLAKTALSKIFSNPALAIGVGVALIALSRVISNSFAGAREKGGPVQKGLSYLVNERGKEMFVPNHGSPAWIEGGTRGFTPPTSGRIIPAWQAKAFAAKFQIPRFQDGGLITGPTFGLLGEGSGINSINPEVVAPLASLKSLLGDGLRQNINVNVTGRLRNRDIRLGQNREGRSQNRTANG